MIIKKLPKTITAQRVYNHVKKHLLTQGEKAYDKRSELCRYRKKKRNGVVLACAAGSVIPDYWYKKEMEGKTVGGLVDHKQLPPPLIPHKYLLQRLQNVHDHCDPTDWAERLKRVAEENELKP